MRVSRAPYLLALVLGILCWSTVPVFIRFLNQYLGNFSQNLFRYLAACALLWVLSLVLFRPRLALGRHLLGLLIPIGFMCCHQLLWVESIRLTSPTTASLLTQFQIVIVGLLAWIFFPAERKAIRSPRFLAGTALALVGVAGFILSSGGDLRGSAFGFCVVLLTAAAWSAYTISVKATIRGIHPVVAFTYVSTGVLVFFLVSTPVMDHPGVVLAVPGSVQVALVVSGILGIALAHVFFYTALSHLSAPVCGTALLLVPLLTGTWSFLIFQETLRPAQVPFGILLLAGSALTLTRTEIPVEGPPD